MLKTMLSDIVWPKHEVDVTQMQKAHRNTNQAKSEAGDIPASLLLSTFHLATRPKKRL
ncbi:hypothetical protein [Neobacillus piezotolerans]|uniref:hypothetical protein n=1 Tax=Neobacillus piezotolerans TaxID=2259171 RepID=UPI0015F1A1E0|nr:hypothetical protein [Neobacillus piezotolerans]